MSEYFDILFLESLEDLGRSRAQDSTDTAEKKGRWPLATAIVESLQGIRSLWTFLGKSLSAVLFLYAAAILGGQNSDSTNRPRIA